MPKCCKHNCEEEAVFRTGTLSKAKCFCSKHYREKLSKEINQEENLKELMK